MSKVEQAVSDVLKYLPNIRPLNEFLHLNMFPGLQKMEFWQAIENSSDKYSTIPFLPISFYQQKYKNGDINEDMLNKELALQAKDEHEKELLKRELFRDSHSFHFPEKSYRPLHKIISEKMDNSLNELTEPLLIRFLANYYDQGFSHWGLPKLETGLLASFKNLIFNSYIPLYPVNEKIMRPLENKNAIEIIEYLLAKIVGDERLHPLYIEECVLSLKGWNGLIKVLSNEPNLILEKRDGTIYDCLAIRLILEYSWIKRLSKNYQPISVAEVLTDDMLIKKSLLEPLEWKTFKIWHEAYEKTYHLDILNKMSSYKPNQHAKQFKIQAVFCIDDRECSLRRFLEELDHELQTFSTPGHYGIDFYYKNKANAFPKKHCPAPVQANYIIEEMHKATKPKQSLPWLAWSSASRANFIFDYLQSFVGGALSALKILYKILFYPKKFPAIAVKKQKVKSKLTIFRNGDEKEGSKFKGYSREEIALRLSNVFKSIGLTQNFSELVMIIGHTATTTNNPYFAAYGCGACSGRNGGVNSRVFCEMANDPEVRKLLKQTHGIDVPDQTFFMPAVHDTTKDVITLFNVQEIQSENVVKLIERFTHSAEIALKKNAKYRCEDFDLLPANISPDDALKETIARSKAVFEPRPELGHTRNALCVIGNRNATRGFSFERRAFLQSYDHASDPTGQWLNGILSAAVPVCGGINLDYFYSRMNNRGIGAGSKLPHNVMGLVALTNGTEDDLQTGLAYQMIELHEPIRILMIVEQTVEIVEKVIKANAGVWDWVSNYWVRFACICPETRAASVFNNGKFEPIKSEDLW